MDDLTSHDMWPGFLPSYVDYGMLEHLQQLQQLEQLPQAQQYPQQYPAPPPPSSRACVSSHSANPAPPDLPSLIRYRPSDKDTACPLLVPQANLTMAAGSELRAPSIVSTENYFSLPIHPQSTPNFAASTNGYLLQPAPLNLGTEKNLPLAAQPAGRSTSSASSSVSTPADSPSSPLSAKPPTTLAAAPDRPAAPLHDGASGPVGSLYSIPPRPKPGRKAATEQPDSKRKQQNREAQRAFRKRRNDKVDDLEAVLRDQADQIKALSHDNSQLNTRMLDLQAKYDEANGRAMQAVQTANHENRRNSELLEQLTSLQRELDVWKATHQMSTSVNDVNAMPNYSMPSGIGMQPHTPPMDNPHMPMETTTIESAQAIVTDGCDDCHQNGDCPCLGIYTSNSGPGQHEPTSDERTGRYLMHESANVVDHNAFQDLEQDFTNYGRTNLVLNDSSNSYVTEGREVSESVDVVVVDREEDSVAPPSKAIINPSDPDPCGFCTNPTNCLCRGETITKLQADGRSTLPSSPKANSKSSGSSPRIKPGTCAQCMANPEQRRFCEGLAKSRPLKSEGDGPSTKRRRLSSIQAKGDVVSCNEAYAIYAQQRRPSASSEKDFETFYKGCIRATAPPTSKRKAKGGPDEPSQRYSAYDVELAGCLLQLRRSSNSQNGGAK